MTGAQITLLIIGIMLLLIWTLRHILISRALRRQILVQPDPVAGPPDNPPLVTILVAAKDEQDNIGDCLDSLAALDYPNLEFIVIDDRSTDLTAEIVRARAAADSRLRLVQVCLLAEGWFGKPHAMQTGAPQANGQWLLFVDADCRLTPGSVSAVMRHALEQGADMLSLWPSLALHTFAEKLIMPMCGSLLAVYYRPDLVNNPKSRAAFANGQFILITCWWRILPLPVTSSIAACGP
jgi:chlorobactene glucosyltransferase